MHLCADLDEAIRKAQSERLAASGVGLTDFGTAFDTEIYSTARPDANSNYVHELVDEDDGDEGMDGGAGGVHPSSMPHRIIAAERKAADDSGVDPMAAYKAVHGSGIQNTRISDRESTYQARRRDRQLSPERGGDVFSGETPTRSYAELLQEQQLAREKAELIKKIEKQEEDGIIVPDSDLAVAGRKRRRWDDTGAEESAPSSAPESSSSAPSHANDRERGASEARSVRSMRSAATEVDSSEWDRIEGGPSANSASMWDSTPGRPSAADDDMAGGKQKQRNRWDETPAHGGEQGSATPPESWEAGAGAQQPRGKRSRWDETPVITSSGYGDATPSMVDGSAATPMAFSGATPTPSQLYGASTPSLSHAPLGSMTPAQIVQARHNAEMDERNRPLSDEELEAMFPKGYRVLEAPAGYQPLRTPSRKLTATPTPLNAGGFRMAETPSREAYGVPLLTTDAEGAAGSGTAGPGDLPFIKPEEMQFFGSLVDGREEEELSSEEAKERKIMTMLLKIKNGTPPQRKSSLRQIAEKAREFGAGPLFNQILPLLMSPSLEDQERHLMVKVIDRVMFKLDDLVRPYVHKILVVIEPMLIDEDYYARIEGREIISNLAKAAGLATMISVMRPDIDHVDEFVRNTTSRAFAVVASALGIPALMPFLKAVCASKKTWQARHTGLKIVQQIAILMGCAVLPHLKQLVEISGPGLVDENQKVRIMSALALAALAEAAYPYGMEAFDNVLRPLWKGIRDHGGKELAAFLKAVGYIIPLMDSQYASWYTKEVMTYVIRQFPSPDEEMKKIVLKVVEQCVATEGVDAEYVRTEIIPEFFKHFWIRRMALDKRNYQALVSTTVAIANKVGSSEIINRVVNDLKDESEPYRRMVMEAIEKVVENLGASDIDPRLEEQLIDGILYAFQEQTAEDSGKTMLSGFGTIVNALGVRCKPYLPQIAGTIKWRLNNKAPQVRMQSSDLISKVAGVMRACGEDALLGHLGVVLFECLGEEYPEVLGSILGGLKAIVNVIGMNNMQPPIKDLLPRLTPILKNRHEKVQENCIDLVGRIAERGSDFVSPKEWMRICFELLDMLKAQKKSIRRACVNTFGYIAKAIGPQDVLHALMNNLKVQERQLRVCTTVAIAIVAETCQPFTVLPALMNEYRTPDLNVQNGVLKAMSFMFEYIGEMARDYVYAVTPMLEDALMDRDYVHRQTACYAVKHLALGLQGLGCEDALQHLLNYVWPNVLETFPHVIQSVFEAIEALRVSLGPQKIMQYLLQGLFHPARRVREAYWKLYNNLYVYSVDALTPVYPRLPDEGPNHYGSTYLDLII
jgi:splicing factor 3B subunit 1